VSKQPLCVAILWHMHQPDYGDARTGEIYLPWTRFHAIKDYYDMAALAAEAEGMRVTINVVPSLIDQLEAYHRGTARETYASLTMRDAVTLDGREKAFLLSSFFQLPWKQMIMLYPRYKELLERRGTPDSQGIYSSGLKRFTTQDYRDLQVWFNLSWCGNEMRRDPAISDMIHKGREFSEEDKRRLLQLQTAFIGRILPFYRKQMEEHGVELSVSPYYHPILPLLCDSQAAREVLPDIALPANRFAFPGDAQEQIGRARTRFTEVFGQAPRGMWPSEGAISDAVSSLARDAGLRWLASDEGVLLNSLKKSGRDSSALAPAQKYRAWRRQDGPALFFRDHGLSDLIGFTYSHWGEEEAVGDFIQRLNRIYEALPDDGRHYVVPVILDGENAWEHYPRNGAAFLGLLYRRLTEADFLQTVTFSEYLDLEPHAESIETIAAGSWIYSSLSTWLGHPEKNAAWDALSGARQTYARLQEAGTELQRASAFQEIMIAEGSDWFWWFGEDHQTQNAAEFDALFRGHLKNVYRLLGEASPEGLDTPIKKADVRTQFRNPVHTISPRIDGRVTDYFEWLDAGFATPAGGGAMHQTVRHLEKVYFGYDTRAFYVRVDFARGGLQGLPPQVSVQLQFVSPRECRLAAERSGGEWRGSLSGTVGSDHQAAVAGGKILEIGIPLKVLGLQEADEVRYFVTLYEKDRELERFPSTGFLVVPVDPWELDQQEWIV